MLVTVLGAGLEESSRQSNSRGKSGELRGDTIRTNLSGRTLLIIMQFPLALTSASIKLREAADTQQISTDEESQYGYLHQIASGAE
jgi:hypothetical protein